MKAIVILAREGTPLRRRYLTRGRHCLPSYTTLTWRWIRTHLRGLLP